MAESPIAAVDMAAANPTSDRKPASRNEIGPSIPSGIAPKTIPPLSLRWFRQRDFELMPCAAMPQPGIGAKPVLGWGIGYHFNYAFIRTEPEKSEPVFRIASAGIVLKDGIHPVSVLSELEMPPCRRKALVATEDEE